MFGIKTRPTMPQEQHIHIHIEQDHSTAIQITQINNKLDKIMASIEEINQQLTDLQTALDTEQAQIAEAIAGLTTQISDLNAIIAAGATPDQLTALSLRLEEIKSDLQSTIPDAPISGEPTA